MVLNSNITAPRPSTWQSKQGEGIMQLRYLIIGNAPPILQYRYVVNPNAEWPKASIWSEWLPVETVVYLNMDDYEKEHKDVTDA
jgi:hypothetical protein